jgi:adenosylcobinamide kinase / adenosylcobinamide-phosphate guanylyltransferase
MNKITLITGGARSGKSSHALALAKDYRKKAFIATASAFDDEMSKRIERHRKDRDDSFFLIEEPLDLSKAIADIPQSSEIAIIDCLTVWVCNLLINPDSKRSPESPIAGLLERLKNPPCNILIVTNEVGMGIIPDNEISREYRDALGSLNQKIASIAHQVVLMISGIPVLIKR